MEKLFEFAAVLKPEDQGHRFRTLGGVVKADHFLVEFLPFRGWNADDVLAGLEVEAGAFVPVPETQCVGEED